MISKNINTYMHISDKPELKKLQCISYILEDKVYFLTIRSMLNNFYVTVTNKFGKVIFLKSGGMLNLTSTKCNTSYSLELMLLDLLKKVTKFGIEYLFLRLDFQAMKKKRVISKVLQKFQIRVIGIQLSALKAFNGVRLKKRRRV